VSGRGASMTPVAARGWLARHLWLLARRTSQMGVLALFLAGPWFGVWIVRGNLSSSRTLDVLDLTDPYVLLQSLAAGHRPELAAVGGALIVAAFYLLAGGRSYCAWVCPLNPVTDAAGWLRRRLGLDARSRMARGTRLWLLAATLLAAVLTGTLAFELVNPVSITHRGIIFGMGLAWAVVVAVFVFELAVSRRGWCGHLCPVGAFYGLLGHASMLRVRADRRSACNDCGDCYTVCPEPHVITPAIKGARHGTGPVIASGDCTNCGRCIDVCSRRVFRFGTRLRNFDPGAGSAPVRPAFTSSKEIHP